jgi:hypothetical protein
MILTMAEITQYLKADHVIEGDDEYMLILSMSAAGEDYFRISTGKVFEDGKAPELVKLGLKMLLTHWYENRGTVVIGTISAEIDFSLKNILFKTKWGY